MFQCPDGTTVNVTSRHLLSTECYSRQELHVIVTSLFPILFCPSGMPICIKFSYKNTLLVIAAAPSHNQRPHSVIPTCIIQFLFYPTNTANRTSYKMLIFQDCLLNFQFFLNLCFQWVAHWRRNVESTRIVTHVYLSRRHFKWHVLNLTSQSWTKNQLR